MIRGAPRACSPAAGLKSLRIRPMRGIEMRLRIAVRPYCAVVFVAGMMAVAILATWMRVGYVVLHPLTFVLLAVAVIFAENLPVQIPRRGGEEEITLSTSFAMALLLAGGLGPAVLAQAIASVVQ